MWQQNSCYLFRIGLNGAREKDQISRTLRAGGLLLVKWSRAANWYEFDSNLYLPGELLRSARPNQLEIDVQVHTNPCCLRCLFLIFLLKYVSCRRATRFLREICRCILSRLTGSLHRIPCRLKSQGKWNETLRNKEINEERNFETVLG